MMQAQEARGLKDRLVSGNFVQRNKMTVRGGSSFNTIQRVLKQDLLETGAAARNPQALRAYKVDRLAMNKVSVFSDGEINVQATRAQRREPFDRQARAGAGAGAGAGARPQARRRRPSAERRRARRGRARPSSRGRAAAGWRRFAGRRRGRRAVHAGGSALRPVPGGGGRAGGHSQARPRQKENAAAAGGGAMSDALYPRVD